MKQDGPFRVEDELNFGHTFSLHARKWVKAFCKEPVTVTKYRAVREHVFDLLQVSAFDQVDAIMSDHRRHIDYV